MNRLPGLDLLRALAVVWVMLFHSYIVGGLGPFDALALPGWMGVDLFFVLSGFLIGGQVFAPLARGERPAFGDFYRRRAYRVLPAYLAVLALYFAWPGFHEADGIAPAWQFLTFTLNLNIDYAHERAFSHAWSLCVEEHFYLVFPLAAWWLSRRPSAARFIAVCVAILAFGMALRGWIWLVEMAPVRGVEGVARSFGQRFIEDIYYPTWTRLDGLTAGVALAALRAWRPDAWSRLMRRANALALAGLVVVAAAIWLFDARVEFWPTVVGYPLLAAGLALLVAAGASDTGVLARVRVPGAAWVAAASYSLYLIHKPVFHLVMTYLGPWLEGNAAIEFAVYAIASLAAGALLHHAIERPFLRLRERRDAPRRLATA
jgi:peptidoglycan/LPS O-acetylase OafA/YrhL